MPDRVDAIVVGGGHNGLVCAAYLARAGLDVRVFERRDLLGGACATEELFDGYRVSSCSYVCYLLQPKVVDELELRRHGFRYHPIDPHGFLPYRDGSHLFTWNDEDRTRAEIERLSPRDAARYPDFVDFWRRGAGLVNRFMLEQPPTWDQVEAYAAEIGEQQTLERLRDSSVAEICSDYFADERLQAAFVGIEDIGDPWAPGSAWTEAYFHGNEFTDYGYSVVTGGMGAIAAAIASAAREFGARIETGRPVDRILVSEGRARGVRLDDGSEVLADVVVSNADPKRTYLGLVGAGHLPDGLEDRVSDLSTGTSYLKFHSVMERLPDISRYLGRDADPRETGYIEITPSLEHYRRAFAETRAGRMPSEPIVHIQIPTVYDDTLTSRDGHVVSIWAQFAPPRLSESTWEAERERTGQALIDYVTEFVPNFRRDMREWLLFTPQDLEERVGFTDGAIRHLDTIPSQLLAARPLPGHGYGGAIDGLYLCGAGTHPGGEVTGAPGHNAARELLAQREHLTQRVA
ncbi:MAG TPA: NAD(P)/FAD-dependent oxidoreductase [Thermoleophilaceae bacterium]|nr:NAD(P)/FAD-dependent oxidoreductase [Thermoleophilaceae bacterium]